MYKLAYLFALGTIFYYIGFAQTALENKLKTASDAEKIEILHQLAKNNVETNPELALQYAMQSLEIAKKLSNPLPIAQSYAVVGKVQASVGNYEKAIDYYEKGLKALDKNEEPLLTGQIYYLIGKSYEDQKEYKKAVSKYEKAAKYIEKTNNPKLTGDLNIAMGNCSADRGNLKDAINYYNKAITNYQNAGENAALYQAYNAIGVAYLKQRNSKKAIEYFTLAQKGNTDKEQLTLVHANIGDAYKDDKKYKLAENAYNQALQYANLTKKPSLIADVYFRMHKMYEKAGDEQKSKQCYEKYNAIHQEAQSRETALKLALLKSQYEEITKQKDEEIAQKENVIQAQQGEITQLESEKKLLEAQKQLKELEAKRLRQIGMYLIAVIALSILVVILIAIGYRNKQRTARILAQKNAEITRQNEQITQQKNELAQAYKDLQEAQEKLILAEKMAAMGKLVKNVAHEINTPIGAVKSAVQLSQQSLHHLVEKLPELSTQNLSHIQPLLNRILQANATQLSTREARQYRKSIEETFQSAGIDNSSKLADELVKMGIIPPVDDLIPVFQNGYNLQVLELAKHIGSIKANTDTIELASDKTKKVVSALKLFIGEEIQSTPQTFSITQSIDEVLAIYNNYLKQGIEVEKQYEINPIYSADPEAIKQVWTHVIFNAIQAMENKGKLTIRVFEQDKILNIIFTDTGHGIPADILPRVFEPFFTTKIDGSGVGLGLYLCKKIIEKYNGKIDIASEPGRTEVHIQLPLSA
ncbi:MAG: tetratricopeptide repeat protein [Bacteroidia bacterium]|nr:tetratricopeptide repeat protein [Bacteroidia bacterium]MDW8302165.1 tetratricopeptide repeat protein [Bacteroidia bacterium]